jgi:hypothetical protein
METLEEMTLKEILEDLDGCGLAITDWDLIEEQLKNLVYTLDSHVRED